MLCSGGWCSAPLSLIRILQSTGGVTLFLARQAPWVAPQLGHVFCRCCDFGLLFLCITHTTPLFKFTRGFSHVQRYCGFPLCLGPPVFLVRTFRGRTHTTGSSGSGGIVPIVRRMVSATLGITGLASPATPEMSTSSRLASRSAPWVYELCSFVGSVGLVGL